jgi:hypothetical protein
MTLPAALHDIARRLARLAPDWSRPARYFEARDELAGDLRRLARAIDAEHNRADGASTEGVKTCLRSY